jgi:DMSO/TMAO reductase YedYZ molybdopterin-dependent catalytic subunit
MKDRRMISALLAAALALTLLPVMTVATSAQTVGPAGVRVDSSTGATPNYRTYLKADLKDMPYEGGYYTCLKATAPYTYFSQSWYGIPMSYLLNVEVGMKTGTTGIKVIASDGYSATLTPAEVTMTNPDGFHTLLAWQHGTENQKNSSLVEMGNDEGPFRLIVPQAVKGQHGVGTDNFNRSVKMVRAIEIQPTPPGMPSADPSKIPPGQVLIYGNVLNRRTFSLSQMKSLRSVSATVKWLNSFPTHGQATEVGVQLPCFLNQPVGLLSGATSVTAVGSDGFPGTFTMDQVNKTYPDGNQMMLSWNENGSDLQPTPVPGGGPLKIVRPQTSYTDVNKSEWVSNVRVLSVGPTTEALPDATRVPANRLIVCGLSDPKNVPDTWYLAEGYTGGGFEEWICIGNPNPWKTRVDITYMIQGEGNKSQTLSVDPMSRATVKVNDAVGDGKSVSAKVVGHEGDSIVVERAMYWNGKAGGHCAAGVNSAAKNWYLAEGSTAGGFETWVLLQNPGDTGAIVKLTYMNESGPVAGPTLNMAAHSRTTVNVADTLAGNWQVSTQVVADVPVIAERAMYWGNRKAGHDAVGVTAPGNEWYMAEGCTAGGFETWVLLQNPGAGAAKATVTYMNETGPKAGPVVDIPAHSRKTINVADTLPGDYQVSTKVTSDKPLIAERSVYFNSRQGGTCETATDSPKLKSLLAEGATDGGFESWILVQNAGEIDATVYITYLTGQGPVERAPLLVPAGKRVSVNEFNDVGANMQVSAQVYSSVPVAVERAVYWNNRIEGHCSKGYASW